MLFHLYPMCMMLKSIMIVAEADHAAPKAIDQMPTGVSEMILLLA